MCAINFQIFIESYFFNFDHHCKSSIKTASFTAPNSITPLARLKNTKDLKNIARLFNQTPMQDKYSSVCDDVSESAVSFCDQLVSRKKAKAIIPKKSEFAYLFLIENALTLLTPSTYTCTENFIETSTSAVERGTGVLLTASGKGLSDQPTSSYSETTFSPTQRQTVADVLNGGSDFISRITEPRNWTDVSRTGKPTSDINLISLSDNPGAPMLSDDSIHSLERVSRSRACCFCWCWCCSCSCIRLRPLLSKLKKSPPSDEDPQITKNQIQDCRVAHETYRSWADSFDNVMQGFTSSDVIGQRTFREFLRSEYSEDNILFWLACEDLKHEQDLELMQIKARLIYDDYISILSAKEVSLDAKVREKINRNMSAPTSHIFDEAQLQIYTLMQRDSYPRFLNSKSYRNLLDSTKINTP